MLFVATENRHLRSSKGWLFDDDECRFFASLSRLDAALDLHDGDYCLLIDEGYQSGEVMALLLRREHDARLKNAVLLASPSQCRHTTSRNGRISIVRKDAMMHHLPSLARNGQGKVDVMDLTRDITGDSEVIRRLRAKIASIGQSGCNVIIYGKTGSGKERVAQSVHHAYCPAPAQVVNCALLEGDLFDLHRWSTAPYWKGTCSTASCSDIRRMRIREPVRRRQASWRRPTDQVSYSMR